MVVYTAYKVRNSLISINPDLGAYDPERYLITLAPAWETWRSQ